MIFHVVLLSNWLRIQNYVMILFVCDDRFFYVINFLKLESSIQMSSAWTKGLILISSYVRFKKVINDSIDIPLYNLFCAVLNA